MISLAHELFMSEHYTLTLRINIFRASEAKKIVDSAAL